jgi:SAM-dependent methyltransferase
VFRKLDRTSAKRIASEWDVLAPIRFQQITSGEDITYHHILVPSVLGLIPRLPGAVALDAGCGIGYLTNLLADHAARVVGVDASAESIDIARAHFGTRAHFVQETLESHSAKNTGTYDLVIANMVLMDVLNLHVFISALHLALRPNGVLIFTITHPCFWPHYYGYAREPWYRYHKELIIESPFKITARTDCPFVSTHIHRPLEVYIGALRQTRFSIDDLREPMPSPDIEALYPFPWVTPRYLIGLCRSLSNDL